MHIKFFYKWVKRRIFCIGKITYFHAPYGILTIMKQAFTHNQAIDICKRYQHFTGHIIPVNNDFEVIDLVVVCPYNKPNKTHFFNLYIKGIKPETIMASYELPEFDVMVISKTINPENPSYSFKDLRTFLDELNVRFDLTIYAE